MAVLWPPVEDGIRAHLQRVYITPLRLDAAFDTEEECAIMLRDEFPDLVEEDLLDALASDDVLERLNGAAFQAEPFRACQAGVV